MRIKVNGSFGGRPLDLVVTVPLGKILAGVTSLGALLEVVKRGETGSVDFVEVAKQAAADLQALRAEDTLEEIS